MAMQAEAKRLYSLEEYLEQEIHSEERHEYVDGEVVLKPGGMPNHNQIAGNLYTAKRAIGTGNSPSMTISPIRSPSPPFLLKRPWQICTSK